jgi:hypothetical protein
VILGYSRWSRVCEEFVDGNRLKPKSDLSVVSETPSEEKLLCDSSPNTGKERALVGSFSFRLHTPGLEIEEGLFVHSHAGHERMKGKS